MTQVYHKTYAGCITALLMFLFLECQPSKMPGTDHKGMTNMDDNIKTIDISSLLKPTNGFVISSVATTTISTSQVAPVINALGTIDYDTRQMGVISSKTAGRIEKLYIHYRFQKINMGQKIMDVYSPELLTNEENLLFLLKNDPDNTSLINAAKERLHLLGMSLDEIQNMINSKKTINAITVYSNYNGHIHEAVMENNSMNTNTLNMKDVSVTTEILSLKEGMYIQKGQELFSVYNPEKAWVLLNIYPDIQGVIKLGDSVTIMSETLSGLNFKGKIDFIEPFYRKNSRTITARVYFDNAVLQIPIGSQVKANINSDKQTVSTLPESAVVTLGIDKVVFKKVIGGFKAQIVEVGNTYNNQIQIVTGLSLKDSVAVNAQFLMDSESFIKAVK